MLRYAETPYAHGIRKKSVPLRYARAQNAHVEKKKGVTLRNDVICPRPFLKNRNVTQRRHMHTSNFKKKSRFVTHWRQMRSNDVEMPATPEMFCAVTLWKPPKCPRPPKKYSWLRYASSQYAHAHAVFSGSRYVTLCVMPKCCLHYGT